MRIEYNRNNNIVIVINGAVWIKSSKQERVEFHEEVMHKVIRIRRRDADGLFKIKLYAYIFTLSHRSFSKFSVNTPRKK